jgi:hypothetical protein
MNTSYVLAADGLNNIIRGSTQQLSDDGKLVDVVLSGEQRFALEHLSENAACTPDVHLHVVLLPREHNLRRPVVPSRDITSHLRVLYAGETEVTDLEIAVFVYENIAGLQVTVDDTGRVHVFQATLCGLVWIKAWGLRDAQESGKGSTG